MISTFYHLSESVSAEAQGGSRRAYGPMSPAGGRSFADYLSSLKSDASSAFTTAGGSSSGRADTGAISASYARSAEHGRQPYNGGEAQRRNTASVADRARARAGAAEKAAAETAQQQRAAEERAAARDAKAAEQRKAVEQKQAEEQREASEQRRTAEKDAAEAARKKAEASEAGKAAEEAEAKKSSEKQAADEKDGEAKARNAEEKAAGSDRRTAEEAGAQKQSAKQAEKQAEQQAALQTDEASRSAAGKKISKNGEGNAAEEEGKASGEKGGEKAARQSLEEAAISGKDAEQASEGGKNSAGEGKNAESGAQEAESRKANQRTAAEQQAVAGQIAADTNAAQGNGTAGSGAVRAEAEHEAMRSSRTAAGEQGGRSRGDGSEKGHKLTVVDMRRDGGESSSGKNGAGSGGSNSESSGRSGDFSKLLQQNGVKSEKSSGGTDQSQTMQFDVRTAGTGTASSGAARTADRASNGLFTQLRQQLGDDIVKKSTILVRENGSGEIRLNLKPDHLGMVRIRITLEDNHIAGKIFVDNQGVRDAFEQNLQNLQRSFREHGFDDASLDVSVGEEKRGRHGGEKENAPAGKTAQNSAARAMGEQVPNAENGYGEEQLIDLVV